MFKMKCDVCGKETKELNTIIFYKKKIDYCNSKKCIKIALKLMKEFQREVKAQNIIYNCVLKSKEKKLLKEIKNNTKED